MTELIKKGKILDKIYTIVGDEGTDIILNSKGNVKIRFGNSFLNLIKNGKISSEAISGYSSSGIKEVGDKSEIVSDGIYFSKADKTFYISLGGILFELNSKEVEDEDSDIPVDDTSYTDDAYLSIIKKQRLKEDQIQLVLDNIKQVIHYLTDNIADIPNNYPVYVSDMGKHYRKTSDGLRELYLNLEEGGTVKGTVTIGDTSISFPESKLNIIGGSPITLFDGNANSLRIEFNEDNIVLIPNNSNSTKFYFNAKGLGINQIPNSALNIKGNEIIDGILQIISPGRIITNDIGSEIFFPGFTGEGFRIYKDDQGRYNAEFDNLTVRQTMRIYELVLEKIRVVKGSFLISQGGSIIKDVQEIVTPVDFYDEEGNYIETKDIPQWAITFEDDYIPFTKNDFARCQVFQYPNVRGYWVWIREAGRNSIYVDKSEFEPYGTDPEVGDEVCQLGNSVDVNRQTAIYLTASDSGNPYIDILSDIKQKSFSGSIRARLGNLKGVTYGLNELDGYGLFSDNVYLKGKLITFGHDPNNSFDVGEYNESNSVDLSKSQLIKNFWIDDSDHIAIYNGDYGLDEKRVIKNKEYIVPNMKEDYDYDPYNKLNPTGDPTNPMYKEVVLNPPEAPRGSIFNSFKNNSITYYLRDYKNPLDPSEGLIWKVITEYQNPKDKDDPDYIEVDLLPIETRLCTQLNLLGTENTLYYSKNFPLAPYKEGDYWITPENEVLICLNSRETGGLLTDWGVRNLAQISIREDVASKLGYESYTDLLTWALSGRTIIEGGYINTRLLEAEIIIGNQLIEGPYMRSDKIEIRDPNNPNVTRWRLNAEAITGGIELVESSSIDGVTTIVERPHVKFLPDGTMYGLRRSNENDNPWRFNSDGSGSLAYNNIYWDTNGKITFGDPTNGTTIDMGLITTGTIALGSGENMFIPNSGITGSNTQTGLTGDNLVRFWAGGTLDAARNTVLNDINGTSNVPTAPFVVTQGGKMYASNAIVEGVVNIGIGSNIGDMHLTKDGFEVFDSTKSSEGTRHRFGMSVGNIKRSGGVSELFGIVIGTKDTISNYWYDQRVYVGRYIETDTMVALLENVSATGSMYSHGPITTKNYFKVEPAISITISQSTSSSNTYNLDLTNVGYIEIKTSDNQERYVSLVGGVVGQVTYIYNYNPWNTHRINIALMNGWFWLTEQRAAGFILTTEGWRLLKGRMEGD